MKEIIFKQLIDVCRLMYHGNSFDCAHNVGTMVLCDRAMTALCQYRYDMLAYDCIAHTFTVL